MSAGGAAVQLSKPPPQHLPTKLNGAFWEVGEKDWMAVFREIVLLL